MNKKELDTIILSHYKSESQTLTSGVEANFLMFKELMHWLEPNEQERWENIKATFLQERMSAAGKENAGAQIAFQMQSIVAGLNSIGNKMGENAK